MNYNIRDWHLQKAGNNKIIYEPNVHPKNSKAKIKTYPAESLDSTGLYFLTVVLILVVTFSIFKLEIMTFLMAKFL